VVSVLYSYNILHSNRDCPRPNSRDNGKNPISLSPPSKILFCSLELPPVAPNRRLVSNRRFSETRAHRRTAITIQQKARLSHERQCRCNPTDGSSITSAGDVYAENAVKILHAPPLQYQQFSVHQSHERNPRNQLQRPSLENALLTGHGSSLRLGMKRRARRMEADELGARGQGHPLHGICVRGEGAWRRSLLLLS